MVLRLVVACMAVLGCLGVQGAGRCQAPLVVFGASMVDVGENAVANPGASAAEFPPYGLDYFHAPAARFSNGRLLIDFISQGLGYGLLHPYLDSVVPNFANGVNFASSGSTARFSSMNGAFPLEVQVKQYKLFKAKVIRSDQSKHPRGLFNYLLSPNGFAKAIHFIETAHNDYISVILQDTPFDSLSLVTSVVSAIEHAIRELHKEGARNIIVMNVIPLGCTPGFLAVSSKRFLKLDNDSCGAFYNSLVDMHNSHLQQLVNQLRAELCLNGLAVFDANAIYMDAIRHPSRYGVRYPLVACCGAGGGRYNVEVACGKNATMNGKLIKAGRCRNPAQYISWDGLHPTETFARHLALGVLSGQYLHPSLSIHSLCNA